MIPAFSSARHGPFLLLIGQALLVFALLAFSATSHYPDTKTYLEFSHQSWLERLSSVRTVGYPMMLHLVSALFGDLQPLTKLQTLLHLAGVFFFWRSLRCFGFAPWSAFFVATPLFYAGMVRHFGNAALSDAPAMALSILCLGFLLRVVAQPARRLPWVGLTLAVFVTIQVRPAYLFLLPLVPLLGPLLFLLHHALPGIPLAQWSWRRLLLGLLVAMALPFMLFSSLRLVTVGHFGLVSFGGYNLIGIVAPLLTPELITKLPEADQPLAQNILERMREAKIEYPFSKIGWIRYGGWANPNNYNEVVHRISVPSAQALYANNPVEVNAALSRLSLAIVKQKPMEYANWLTASLSDGACTTLRVESTLPALLVLMLPFVLITTVRRATGALPQDSSLRHAQVELATTILLALGYWFSGLLLVVLVEPPIERYLFGVSTFLPSIPALVLYRHASFLWPGKAHS